MPAFTLILFCFIFFLSVPSKTWVYAPFIRVTKSYRGYFLMFFSLSFPSPFFLILLASSVRPNLSQTIPRCTIALSLLVSLFIFAILHFFHWFVISVTGHWFQPQPTPSFSYPFFSPPSSSFVLIFRFFFFRGIRQLSLSPERSLESNYCF